MKPPGFSELRIGWKPVSGNATFHVRGSVPLAAEKFDVNVGAESDVVGQIPADMVWIGIENDVVTIPEPVVAVSVVRRRNAEEEAVKTEALTASTSETVDMGGTKGAWEVSVLPRMGQVVTCVAPTGIVADPVIGPGIYVGRIRMSRLLGKISGLGDRRLGAPTTRRNGGSFGWRSGSAIRGNRCAFGRTSGTRSRSTRRDMSATDWSACRPTWSSLARSSTSLSRSSTTLSVSALLRKNNK